jgi:hypothetical protein
MRRHVRPLPVIQPEQPRSHQIPPVPNRSARGNQNSPIGYRP